MGTVSVDFKNTDYKNGMVEHRTIEFSPKYFDVKNSFDLLERTSEKNSVWSEIISTKLENYGSSDLNITLQQLKFVGDYLAISYEGALCVDAHIPILKIINNYHTLVHETLDSTNLFMNSSFGAIQLHKKAMEGPVDDMLPNIIKTLKIASSMASKCLDLYTKSDKLCEDAEREMGNIIQERTICDQERNMVLKSVEEIKTNIAELKSKGNSYEERIVDLKKQAKEAYKEEEKERKRRRWRSILRFITFQWNSLTEPDPVINVKDDSDYELNSLTVALGLLKNALNTKISQLQTLKDKGQDQLNSNEIAMKYGLELEIQDLKDSIADCENDINKSKSLKDRQYHGKKRSEFYKQSAGKYKELLDQATSKIHQSVKKLDLRNYQATSLAECVESLGISVWALAIIKTLFLKLRLLWKSIKDQIRELADISEIEDQSAYLYLDIGLEFFKKSVVLNGINWMCFSKINYNVNLSFKEIVVSCDKIYLSLPCKNEKEKTKESKSRIQSMPPLPISPSP
ncbi:hypothetical protein ACTFIZ_011824 [Dictyostelium cf. discoideum]